MKAWLDIGYDPSTLKHRELVLEAIEKYSPTSLLDVGCASGPDLALLRLTHPEVQLQGFDLAIENVGQARGNGFNVEQADLYTKLPTIPDNSYDVVLSNGVMMYVELKCIKELLRIARKAVILSERDYNGDMLRYLEELNLQPHVVKITEETRDSWKENGFIYDIPL